MAELRDRRRMLSFVLLAGIAYGSISGSSGRAEEPSLPPELEKVRAALDKYQDPYAAFRDGYFSTVRCVHYPHWGVPDGCRTRPAGWAFIS